MRLSTVPMLMAMARRCASWRAGAALPRRRAPRHHLSATPHHDRDDCAEAEATGRRRVAFAPLPPRTTDDVLAFWYADRARRHWFASTAAFDAEVAGRYGAALDRVSVGTGGGASADIEVEVAAVADWARTAPVDAVLAHVLLWDQVRGRWLPARNGHRVAPPHGAV